MTDSTDARSPFYVWLDEHHPGVRLHPMQHAWVEAKERGESPVWVGGMASGRTFILRLYSEFLRSSYA